MIGFVYWFFWLRDRLHTVAPLSGAHRGLYTVHYLHDIFTIDLIYFSTPIPCRRWLDCACLISRAFHPDKITKVCLQLNPELPKTITMHREGGSVYCRNDRQLWRAEGGKIYTSIYHILLGDSSLCSLLFITYLKCRMVLSGEARPTPDGVG